MAPTHSPAMALKMSVIAGAMMGLLGYLAAISYKASPSLAYSMPTTTIRPVVPITAVTKRTIHAKEASLLPFALRAGHPTTGVPAHQPHPTQEGWKDTSILGLMGCSVAAATLFICRKLGYLSTPPLVAAFATSGEIPRRSTLISGIVAGGLAACAPAVAQAPRSLGTSIQAVLRERAAAGTLAISAADIMRLVFHDAVTYDPETRTGGCNGSIRFPEELERPENAGLAPVVDILGDVQQQIQRETGVNVTFTDVMAWTGSFIIALEFKRNLCAKTDAASCEILYNGYGNKPPTLRLGRVDATKPEPAGRVPWTGSSVDDFKASAKKLGLTVKELCCIAPALLPTEEDGIALLMKDSQCEGILADLEKSKKTTTRTTYEINVFRAYGKLANVSRFDEKQYG